LWSTAYHGRFVKLVPDEQVVEVVEFETVDQAMRGEMIITITLTDTDGSTDVVGVHEGLPTGVPPADNEAGWRSAAAANPQRFRELPSRRCYLGAPYRGRLS
jgi:uncharacterized protein YndB with AHSA1/START domain